jgi:transcription-repair coupling factor (superfamily II helicase)
MLERTIEEMKGSEILPEIQSVINLKVTIKIPPEYLPDESQRLRTYKRISTLKTDGEVADLRAELEDRYGPLPPEVDNLMEYARLRLLSERLLVKSLEKQKEAIHIQFHEKTPVKPEKLIDLVSNNPGISLTPDGILRVQAMVLKREELFPALRSLLLELEG